MKGQFENEIVSEKERKKNLFTPTKSIHIMQLDVGLNKCDNIRKVLNKSHMGKVPSKVALC